MATVFLLVRALVCSNPATSKSGSAGHVLPGRHVAAVFLVDSARNNEDKRSSWSSFMRAVYPRPTRHPAPVESVQGSARLRRGRGCDD